MPKGTHTCTHTPHTHTTHIHHTHTHIYTRNTCNICVSLCTFGTHLLQNSQTCLKSVAHLPAFILQTNVYQLTVRSCVTILAVVTLVIALQQIIVHAMVSEYWGALLNRSVCKNSQGLTHSYA